MNPTDIPTRTRHFVFYEARLIDSYERLPTHFLNGWKAEHMPQGGVPHFLTTIPRDGMDGLPKDWWHEPSEIFIASSVPLEGKLWLEQNDDTVHVVPISGHDAHAIQESPPFTRLSGSPDSGPGVHDVFELRFDGTTHWGLAQGGVPSPRDMDMSPIRATAERLLTRFDHLHPESQDDANYLLWSHRRHLSALLTLPPGPWILVGLAGRARVVVV